MPHTNEEMKKRFEKEFNSLYGINVSVLNSEPVMIGNPPIADLLSFINQEISDLKKSIREEVERIQKAQTDNGFGRIHSLDEILSLKSLEWYGRAKEQNNTRRLFRGYEDFRRKIY